MKIYITKPAHSEYAHGRIPLENNFSNIDDLIDNCTIWFFKPKLEKPFIDIFGDKFCFRGWFNFHNCHFSFQHFSECEVKEKARELILSSISDDFSETYKNKHYRWIVSLDVSISLSETPGNFNLYLKKPSSVHDIQYAGIDRFSIFTTDPRSDSFDESSFSSLKGYFFRKTPEVNEIMVKMWKENIKSFNVEYDDDFLFNISEFNHVEGKDCKLFIAEFFANINLI